MLAKGAIQSGRAGRKNLTFAIKADNDQLVEMKVLASREKSAIATMRRLAQQVRSKAEFREIFVSTLCAGEKVQKRQANGKAANLFGEALRQIIAPVSGVILLKTGAYSVNRDDTLFCIAYSPSSISRSNRL